MKQTDTIRDMLLAEFGEQNHDYLDRLLKNIITKYLILIRYLEFIE